MKKLSFLMKTPENQWHWLGIALLLKCLVIVFLMYNLDLFDGNGVIGVCNGDCPDYLLTARNFAETGTFGKSDGEQVLPYAGRMPGYDVALAPLSIFFEEKVVMNSIYILQILLSTLTTYFLAKTAYLIFKSETLFVAVLFIYGINSFVTFYDLFILTESFCVSALIISVYLFVKGSSQKDYLLSGALLTWAILMRPYLLPAWVVFNLYILFHSIGIQTLNLNIIKHLKSIKKYLQSLNKLNLTLTFKILLSFNSTFLLTEFTWVTRNYIQFNQFIPVVTDVHAGLKEGKFLALMEFVQAWGGDMVSWNPNAEITLFYKMNEISALPSNYQSMNDLPSYIFTDAYNADSLNVLKNVYAQGDNPTLSIQQRIEIDKKATDMLRQYRNTFISEKPFYFYVVAPMRLLPKFLLHSGSYNISNLPFAKQNLFQKAVKISYSALYYFTWVIGFGFCFYYLFSHRKAINVQYLLLMAVPFYILMLCPLVLRRIEYRYFITAYPFLTILACYVLTLAWEKISKTN
jgi:hypothetical protein